jgi:hypothetical protein
MKQQGMSHLVQNNESNEINMQVYNQGSGNTENNNASSGGNVPSKTEVNRQANNMIVARPDSNQQKIDLKKLMMVSMKTESNNDRDFFKRSLEQKFNTMPTVQTLPGHKSLDLNVSLPEIRKNFNYDENKFFDGFETKFTDLIEDRHENVVFPNLKINRSEFCFINTLEDKKKYVKEELISIGAKLERLNKKAKNLASFNI